MILLWVACQTPAWTETSALAAHRARLDGDHNGRVTAEEYEKTRWNGPPFGSADADGDGDLSVPELATLNRAQSPTGFDGPGGAEAVKLGGAGVALLPDAQRDVQEWFSWMGEALESVGQTGPDAAAVQAAVASGSMQSPESRALLGVLRPRWEAQGWAWPQGVP